MIEVSRPSNPTPPAPAKVRQSSSNMMFCVDGSVKLTNCRAEVVGTAVGQGVKVGCISIGAGVATAVTTIIGTSVNAKASAASADWAGGASDCGGNGVGVAVTGKPVTGSIITVGVAVAKGSTCCPAGGSRPAALGAVFGSMTTAVAVGVGTINGLCGWPGTPGC